MSGHRDAQLRVDADCDDRSALARKVPKRAWQKLSAGRGAKGQRFYAWAVIDLADPCPGHRQLFIRRNRTSGELAYCRCYSPDPVPLTTTVRVAGPRWRVEETFQSEKGLAGLDEHQVRLYPSWIRWVTLAMLAHAFLAVVRANETARHSTSDDLVPLSCNEIQRLFITLATPASPQCGPPARLVRLATPPSKAITHQPHYQRQAASQT